MKMIISLTAAGNCTAEVISGRQALWRRLFTGRHQD